LNSYSMGNACTSGQNEVVIRRPTQVEWHSMLSPYEPHASPATATSEQADNASQVQLDLLSLSFRTSRTKRNSAGTVTDGNESVSCLDGPHNANHSATTFGHSTTNLTTCSRSVDNTGLSSKSVQEKGQIACDDQSAKEILPPNVVIIPPPALQCNGNVMSKQQIFECNAELSWTPSIASDECHEKSTSTVSQFAGPTNPSAVPPPEEGDYQTMKALQARTTPFHNPWLFLLHLKDDKDELLRQNNLHRKMRSIVWSLADSE